MACQDEKSRLMTIFSLMYKVYINIECEKTFRVKDESYLGVAKVWNKGFTGLGEDLICFYFCGWP